MRKYEKELEREFWSFERIRYAEMGRDGLRVTTSSVPGQCAGVLVGIGIWQVTELRLSTTCMIHMTRSRGWCWGTIGAVQGIVCHSQVCKIYQRSHWKTQKPVRFQEQKQHETTWNDKKRREATSIGIHNPLWSSAALENCYFSFRFFGCSVAALCVA